MWQTVVVLLIVVGVSIYLVRYYVRAYRAEGPTCSGCSGGCPHAGAESPESGSEQPIFKDRSCRETGENDCEPMMRAGKPAPQKSKSPGDESE